MLYAGQILEQALLMFPMVLGIYASFAVLRIADLSVDGSFLLGASIFASLCTNGCPLWLATLLAPCGGALAGVICAVVQKRERIDPLIVGILMTFILHSVSLVVMGRPNIGLLHSTTIFNATTNFLPWAPLYARVAVLVMVGVILACGLRLILASKTGLWLKAFGNNQGLVALLGSNPERFRIIGLALGNALAALSGCLTAQASGYADINMGFGQALIGIAMILVGKEIVHVLRKSQLQSDGFVIVCVFFGVVIYFLLTNELIRLGLDPVFLKMAVGLLLIVFLMMSSKRASRTGFSI